MAGLINISELLESEISLTDFLIKADEDGLATKTTIQKLSNAIASYGNVAFKGGLLIADTPSDDGFYLPLEDGTYTNAGSIVIDLTTGLNIIIKQVAVFSKLVIPLDLSDYVSKTNDVEDGIVLGSQKVAKSGDVKTFSDNNVNSNISHLSSEDLYKQIEFTQEDGYIDKTTGGVVISGTWRNTGFVKVSQTDTIKRIGVPYNNTSSGSVAVIAYYDADKLPISQYIGNVLAEQEFKISDVPTCEYIKVSSTDAYPLSIYFKRLVNIKKIDGLRGLQDVTGVLSNGYYNSSGVFIASDAWRTTGAKYVIPGEKYKYSTQSVGAELVIGLDEDGLNPTIVVAYSTGVKTDVEATVPAGVYYIILNGVATAPLIKLETNLYLWEKPETIDFGFEYYMPKKAYGLNGDVFKMNPYGIIAKHPDNNDLDLVWSTDNSNQKQLIYTPSTETTKELILKSRVNGVLTKVGTTELNVSQSPSNPASAHYFIHLGDSTVKGVSSAGIEGATVNELSRRFNGTGTELLIGAESPSALAFSNIQFIGTLGDQAIKHEGRGGWSLFNYLNTETLNGDVNAFYNPSSSKFDLDYYISNESFTQITALGDNLTILIDCTWNSVYNHSLTNFKGWLTELLDLINTARPATKVVLTGIPTPPYINKKTFTGSRDVSFEEIMRTAVINYSNLYQEVEEDPTYSGFVEFLPLAPFTFPESSYPFISEKLSARHSETYQVYTDYVHPNEVGYAQKADAYFYYILNKYC